MQVGISKDRLFLYSELKSKRYDGICSPETDTFDIFDDERPARRGGVNPTPARRNGRSARHAIGRLIKSYEFEG
jgi:hypothetical protein